MPRVKRLPLIKSLTCFFVMALTVGCSNTISQQLLNGRPGLETGNSLALPPADTLQIATPDQDPAFVEESELSADVPTLADLSTRRLDGIDAPKIGLSLEEDIAANKIGESIVWRGKRSADGVDLANRNGALCSGSNNNSLATQSIKVACSDGRIGNLQLTGGASLAQLKFKNSPVETVEFVN